MEVTGELCCPGLGQGLVLAEPLIFEAVWLIKRMGSRKRPVTDRGQTNAF